MKGAYRRIVCLVLAMVLLALAGAPALASSRPSGAYVVMVSKDSKLCVRSSPYLADNVQAKLSRGAVVVYDSTAKGWWKVQYSGGTGYVDSRYLSSVAASPDAVYTSVVKLRVRFGPSTSALVYRPRLKPGTKVTLVRQSGSWVMINYKGHTGWVASKYLRRVK